MIHARNAFAIDLRSLSLFRILLGLLTSVDAAQKLLLAETFYSDGGVMPRLHWIEHYMDPLKFSLHLAAGDLWFQQLLIGLQLLAALAFTLGWKCRASNFVLLLLLCSLHNRNHLVLSAADQLLRLGLFWCLFLPMGARFSWNRRAGGGEVLSLGGAGLLLQLLYMYLFTAFLKLHPVWTQEYSAVYYALHVDIFAKPLALRLRELFLLTQLATALTLLWEFLGPALALLLRGRAKLAVSLAFQLFHLGLFFSLELGLFPFVCMAYWVLFWPASFWESAPGKKVDLALGFPFRKAPLPPELSPPGRASNVLAGASLALVTLVSLDSLELRGASALEHLRPAARFLHLDQRWDMFAPYPIRNDGWFVMEGTLRSGETLDLLTGRPVEYQKPRLPSAAYGSSEWRKFLLNAWDSGREPILQPLANFICMRSAYNQRQVVSVRVEFMKETTPPPRKAWPPVEKVLLYQHHCSQIVP
jgi:hypothetical protein